jgi:hypothetical protein
MCSQIAVTLIKGRLHKMCVNLLLTHGHANLIAKLFKVKEPPFSFLLTHTSTLSTHIRCESTMAAIFATARYIRLQYANGDRYEGYWLDAMQCPHGPGTYFWVSGVRYDGSWANGKKHGYGTQTYPTGDRYEGGWKDGQWHGYGELIKENGDRLYQGGFIMGQEHGFALIRRRGVDSRVYEGGMRQSAKHGYGKLSTPMGTMEGGFKDDKQDGWQEIRAPNRHDYSGTYKDGKMEGVGRMFEFASGKVYEGVWQNNDYKGKLKA